MTKQQIAYRAVRTALKNGVLKRPKRCQYCGKGGFASDGRSLIHAHHTDYSKPLDVEWICAKCHRQETPLPKKMGASTYGERNGAAKLNWELVKYIRTSDESALSIAKRLGMSNSTINSVRNGTSWKLAASQRKEG